MTKKLAVAAFLVLAGCGGGGGASTSVPSSAAATPSPAPTQNTSGWQNTAKLSFTFRVASPSSSAAHRKAAGVVSPKYISGSTTNLNVKINSVNGSATLPSWAPTGTTAIALSVGGNCAVAGAAETCTVTIPAPPGTVNYTFTATDGSYDLSTQTGDQTITQGTAATIAVTLKGIVVAFQVNPGSFTLGTSQTEALAITAYDADGNPITGSADFADPITITENSAAGQVTLQNATTSTSGTTVTMENPSDDINLTYTGKAINIFTLTPSGAVGDANEPNSTIVCAAAMVCTIGIPQPNDVALSGTTVDGNAADSSFGFPTVFFAAISGTQVVNVSETDFTGNSADAAPTSYGGQFDIALDAATCGSGASAVASVSAAPATSFTITPLNVGVCRATLTEDGAGYPLTDHASSSENVFYISVTTAAIGLNGTHRK